MTLRSHVIASVIFSSVFLLIFKSWPIAILSFVSGVLIDCDHLIDYLLKFRKHFRVKEFFDAYYDGKMLFIIIVFHSWELLLLLNIYAFLISGNMWIRGITLGFTQHVALDQAFSKRSRWKYFFIWRVKKGFNANEIFQN